MPLPDISTREVPGALGHPISPTLVVSGSEELGRQVWESYPGSETQNNAHFLLIFCKDVTGNSLI